MSVLIVGGGLAGACAATHLAKSGRDTTLFERDRQPAHKVCGEFLTAEGLDELAAIGVDPFALGATDIQRLRVISGQREVEVALPFAAAGLSRRVLDGALRDKAAEAGADLRLGQRVTSTTDRSVQLPDGTSFDGSHVLIATGKHSLRGVSKREAPRAKDLKIGFKEHLMLNSEATDALANCVELHFFSGGYVGLMPLGEGLHNFSFTVSSDLWQSHGKDYRTLLDGLCQGNLRLGDRLGGAQSVMDKPLSIAGVPYGYCVWHSDTGSEGSWPLGDQAAVTPSLTGAGMALALTSGRLASQHILSPKPDRAAYVASLSRTFSRQVSWARSFEKLLESEQMRPLALSTARVMPGLLSMAAHLTRLPAASRT